MTKQHKVLTILSLSLCCHWVSSCRSEAEFTGRQMELLPAKVLFDQEYETTFLADNEQATQPAYGVKSQKITLQETPFKTVAMQQEARRILSENFNQGHDGQLTTQSFKLSRVGKLDLLVVIDNSSSMGLEQAKLKTGLKALTDSLGNVDWQLGVITSDAKNDKCLREGLIRYNDANRDKKFEKAIDAGVSGWGYEQGIRQAYNVLTSSNLCGVKDFVRPDASLAVLFVSDEDSYCEGDKEGVRTTDDSNCNSKKYPNTHPNTLIDKMVEVKAGEKSRAKAYALLWDDGVDATCKHDDPSRNAEIPGRRYREVLSFFGGIEGSICQSDYTSVLKQISSDVARIVVTEFQLQHRPEPGSLSIKVDNQQYTDFNLVDKKISLNGVSSSNENLEVTYRYAAKPKFDRVKIKQKFDQNTLDVTFNGKPVDPDTYSILPLDSEIYFHVMPPDAAKIQIKFREGKVLPQTAKVKDIWKISEITEIEVGGVLLTSDQYTFDPNSGIITFAETPADGVGISVKYTPLDRYRTHYGLRHGNLDKLVQLEVKDELTGEVIEVEVQGNDLIFKESDVTNGRNVIVTLDYGQDPNDLVIKLDQAPLNGSFVLEAFDGDFKPYDATKDVNNCLQEYSLADNLLTFKCFPEGLMSFRIKYQYVAKKVYEFEIDQDVVVPEGAVLSVFVDGAKVEFEKKGNVIVVDQSLIRNKSKVRVLVTEKPKAVAI